MIFPRSHTPRWIVFVLDLLICIISIVFAYYLRFNFNLPGKEIDSLSVVVPLVLVIRGATFIIFRSYANLIRYTSTKDTERIFIVVSVGSVIFVLSNIFGYFFVSGNFLIPSTIIVIDFFITSFLMSSSRLIIKTLYHELASPTKKKTNVILYGAGQLAAITKRTLDRDIETSYKVVAFIDDEHSSIGKKLEGTTIHSNKELSSLLQKYNVEKLIITQKNIDPIVKNRLLEECLSFDTKVMTVPDVNSWINGELSLNQLKKLRIEDLLERPPIRLDEKNIREQHEHQVILVTGAAGSIGRELVLQISKYSPERIILFDQAESPLYDIELELKERFKFYDFEIVIGDMTNHYRVSRLFEMFKPSIVYHAGAYKHVPMMENNPVEAINTNVWGTKNVADLSIIHKVRKFVMISTDKAVNPTNIMGASKRIAEIYTQSLNIEGGTAFITTRFGNVLGSNGSVIPRFKKQIEEGGPITVTHPEVTRFFMTIPEACQLVLEAGTMGKGGEIFIFDMGKSVKIVDLAKKMIKLAGLSLGKDIQINFTGLRPGEKLYEELLNTKENTLPTHHSQIMIAKVRKCDPKIVENCVENLIKILPSHENFEIVRAMKQIVPEFKSKNSIYEKLDSENEEMKKIDVGHGGF